MIRSALAILAAMFLLCAALTALLTPRTAHASPLDWSRPDQTFFTALIACEAYDVMQTRHAMQNGGHEENPLYGSHPSMATLVVSKALVTALIGWIVDRFPRYRSPGLVVSMTVCGVGVDVNASRGMNP